MKKFFIVPVILLFVLAACGKPVHRVGINAETEEDQETLFSESANSSVRFEGTFALTEIEFDGDTDDAVTTSVIVSTILRNVFVTEGGVDKFKQVKLDSFSSIEFKDNEFKLVYKIVNGSNNSATIGKFSEGTQSGTYEIIEGLNDTALIRFSLNNPNGDLGFGDTTYDGASYVAEYKNYSLYISTEAVALDGSYLTRLKAYKKSK